MVFKFGENYTGLALYAALLIGTAAWLQAAYTNYTAEAWVTLITNALLFPVGIVDGLGIWLGLW
jgi:hypothetical protein